MLNYRCIYYYKKGSTYESVIKQSSKRKLIIVKNLKNGIETRG